MAIAVKKLFEEKHISQLVNFYLLYIAVKLPHLLHVITWLVVNG